jgi:thioredoxin:protein disulfide reductase
MMNRVSMRFLLSVFSFSLMLGFASVQAAEVELIPSPIPEGGEIGKNLVFVFQISLADGALLAADSIELRAETVGGENFFSTPYPTKIISNVAGTVQIEWTAPLPENLKPAEHQLKFHFMGKDTTGQSLTGSWSGNLQVDFGEGWSANKISNFIEERGMFLFLLLLFGFGLLMSLSPCIYPMIPITLAVIGTQSKEKGILHGLVMSLTYVIGMALVYAIIGYLSATVASGITAFMQSPVVMVPIALLLIVLSFSMFGAYELQAPQFMRDKLGSAGGGDRSGLVGVFIMGMVAGLIASPCVGPFLGGLLLMLSTTGDGLLAFISLFTFGMGMGVLLIGVGTFPALLGSMPQAGGWMETLNRGMGLLLVGMALYFLRPESVIPAPYFYPLIGAVMVLVGVFFGAFDSMSHESGWWDRTRKALGILTLISGLIFFVGSNLQYGFLGEAWRSVLPEAVPAAPMTQVSTLQSASATPAAVEAPLPQKVQWEKIHTGENVQAFMDQKRAEAKAAGKPIMIDFWAQWCVYCKKLDKAVWNQPEVVKESLRFVTIKVDATKADDDEMTAIKNEFKVPGLPRVIFIDSRGEILHGRSSAFKPAAEMLEVMKGIR